MSRRTASPPPHRGASLATRLTWLFALVASLALAVLGAVTLLALNLHFEAQDREVLHAHMQRARSLLARVDNTGALSALPQDLHAAFVTQKDLAVRVQGAYGQPLFEQRSEAQMPAALLARPATAPPVPLRDWREGRHSWRGSAMVMPLPMPGAAPLTVAMALDIGHQQTCVTSLRRAWIGYVLLAAAVCALLGGWAVRRGLKPLALMRAQAGRISAGQLDARMPVDEAPVELAGLASTLNAMLARLESAFARLSTYSTDIAHELRAPLAQLLAQTHGALSQPQDGAAYRQALAAHGMQLQRLSRTVDDMLFLAQAEHGELLPTRQPVALGAEVQALFGALQAQAADRRIALRLQGDGAVLGDAPMLRRAIGNLLSNALRHTPEGGAIDVTIAPQGADVALRVRNDGTPIAPADLPRLFDRFYRAKADQAAPNTSPGAGLGLPITQAIVQAHGGQITAQADGAGNVFALVLPAAPRPPGS